MTGFNLSSLLLPGAALYLGGTAEMKNMLSGGGNLPALKPMKINTQLGLNQNQRAHFKNLVDNNTILKRASQGVENMKHREIAKKYMEKRAAKVPEVSDIGKFLSRVVRPGMQSILYGLGAGALASTMYDKYQDSQRTQEAYKEMFNRFPELQDTDPAKIDDYWGLMSQYSPSMTRNPLVAGQFIKNMVEYDLKGVDFPTLKSIIDIDTAANKKHQDSLSMVVKGIGSSIS